MGDFQCTFDVDHYVCLSNYFDGNEDTKMAKGKWKRPWRHHVVWQAHGRKNVHSRIPGGCASFTTKYAVLENDKNQRAEKTNKE